MTLTSDITVSDFFCGAGGSSTGARAALKGRGRVIMAANHWQRAIETHQLNHPDTAHDIADLQASHASRYPRTTIAWFSPSCTSHSLAKGKKRNNLGQLDLWGETGVDPAEERSRATMREVVEFSEYHRYEIVIVENVVDVKRWQHYDTWLTAMHNLGYEHKALYLNAMFFNVPQSRDRIYIVFWRKGNRAPDLDFRPVAWCEKHGVVSAVQTWKTGGKQAGWGKYGERQQYLYRCPTCGSAVKPPTAAAASIIDWSIKSERIGNRKHALKDKTMDRVRAGVRKFARPVIVDTAHGGTWHYAYPVDGVIPSVTAKAGFGLTEPLLLSYYNGDTPARSASDPLYTVATTHTPPVIMPPFLNGYFGTGENNADVASPMPTVMGKQHHALVTPFVSAYYGFTNRLENTATSPNDPLPTIPTENRFGVVVPPFMLETGGVWERGATPADGVLPTLMTRKTLSLIDPFIAVMKNPLGKDGYTMPPVAMDQPLTTLVASASQHALVTPPTLSDADIEEIVQDCGFRMLNADELKLAMSFPTSYIITGNKGEQVKQVGNAVCPNVAEWIVSACIDSLEVAA